MTMTFLKVSVVLLISFLLPSWGAEHNPLLPRPQKVRYGVGRLSLSGLTIGFQSAPSPEDGFAGRVLSEALSQAAGTSIPVAEQGSGRQSILLERTGPTATLLQTSDIAGPDSRESYRITVKPTGVTVKALSSAGLFYAVQTIG